MILAINRYTIVSVLLLALGGCGFAGFAYNRAPDWVAGEFDDAFGLDAEQSRALDERLLRFFAWHREQELERYRVLLERAADASADGIDADEFLAVNREFRTALRRSVARAIDELGDLAVTLTPQQVERFRAYLAESSERYRDYLDKTPQQQEIYRVERNLERLENWFGDFDFADRERIVSRLGQLPDNYRPWLRFREARHEALIAVLFDATRGAIDSERLKFVMLSPDSDYARAYEPLRHAYWRAYAELLEDISAWVDTRQRQRVAAKLRDYADLVSRLNRG